MDVRTVGRLQLLTARELEVLQCLVDGLGPTQLATHLYISPNTARTHVKSIRQKLGVHSMLAIASLAVSEGMRPTQTPPRRTAPEISTTTTSGIRAMITALAART